MGKYMRKAKVTDDVSVMEVAASTVGVRTRAKTLALQLLKSSSSYPDSTSPSDACDDSCYLQLRSRRLRKVSTLRPQQAQKILPEKLAYEQGCDTSPPSLVSTRGVSDRMNHGFMESASVSRPNKEDGFLLLSGDVQAEDYGIMGTEASFGENVLDSETRGRLTRESTPCSLVRDVDVVTPGSSTRQTSLSAASHRSQNALFRNIPSTYEMEEFFTHAEQQQQRHFVEKYNFDVFTDTPLPGRYEWLMV